MERVEGDVDVKVMFFLWTTDLMGTNFCLLDGEGHRSNVPLTSINTTPASVHCFHANPAHSTCSLLPQRMAAGDLERTLMGRTSHRQDGPLALSHETAYHWLAEARHGREGTILPEGGVEERSLSPPAPHLRVPPGQSSNAACFCHTLLQILLLHVACRGFKGKVPAPTDLCRKSSFKGIIWNMPLYV